MALANSWALGVSGWPWNQVATPSTSRGFRPASSMAIRLACVASVRVERPESRLKGVQPTPTMAVLSLIGCSATPLQPIRPQPAQALALFGIKEQGGDSRRLRPYHVGADSGALGGNVMNTTCNRL